MICLSHRRRTSVATKNSVQGLIWLAFKKWGLWVLLNASLSVAARSNTSGLGGGFFFLPLTKQIVFKTRLQRGNRVQIPKYVRWSYKLETTQILKATIQVVNLWVASESFLTRPSKDGRISIPLLIIKPNKNLQGHIMRITLQPL